jgi:hypothetical protein
MGLFVYFEGCFKCIRCLRPSKASIQTKLLRHGLDNSSHEYRIGDAEEIVGLEDYCSLHPWDGGSQLVVAVGDWDCEHCNLNWQWAKAVFDVRRVAGRRVATISELSGLQPCRAVDLEGIHFIEPDLAQMSGLWELPPQFNWPAGLARWQECPVSERCERVASGFREWCREVAGIGRDA